MSPQEAQRTAQNARRLLTAHILNPYDYAVLDALLWRCRRPGRDDLTVAYTAIARISGVCRDTAIESVRKLTEIGIIRKIKNRTMVRWGRNRANVASRQAANTYVFCAVSTESPAPSADKGIVRFKPSDDCPPVDNSVLERALAKISAAMKIPLPQ